jgi:hypothetical protein
MGRKRRIHDVRNVYHPNFSSFMGELKSYRVRCKQHRDYVLQSLYDH